VVHFPNVLVGDPLFSSIASQMVGDFQPSVGEKTYTFEDVQGVSVHVFVHHILFIINVSS